jgi:hypothetical protein
MLLSLAAYAFPLTQTPIPNSNPALLFKGLSAKLGPIIPGLDQGYTPQGLIYSEEHDCFFISHYKKGQASCVTAIDAKSHKLLATFHLFLDDGLPNQTHAGGIALSDNHLWVCATNQLHTYKLPQRSKWHATHNLHAHSPLPTPVRASFCTMYRNALYVGEFAQNPKSPFSKPYPSKLLPPSTEAGALLTFPLKGPTTSQTYLQIPTKVQAVHITDKLIYFSRSYGRANPSSLEVYPNNLNQKPKLNLQAFVNNTSRPHLHAQPLLHSYALPPMSEGITIYKKHMVILFESGSKKYRWGSKGCIDRLIFLPQPQH